MQLYYNVLGVEKVTLMKGIWVVETNIYMSRCGAILIASNFGKIFAVLRVIIGLS
jgi:hypothetical protein